MKLLLALSLIMVLQGCKHPLAIEGKGDIIERLFGDRGCTLEEFQANSPRCTENEVIDDDYLVSYEAIPRPGWRFLRWSGTACASDPNSPWCDYDVSREWVNHTDAEWPGAEFAATRAVFVEQSPTALIVSGQANGGFGPLLGGKIADPENINMVVAAVLLAGETVVVQATGEINIATNSSSGGIFTPPDGTDFSADTRPSPFYYFPLEEASVDAGELSVPVAVDVDLYNIGALIGAFIPQPTVRAAGFIARNDDPDPDTDNFGSQVPLPVVAGSIPAAGLFHVGSGPFRYKAQEDGTLFLGVNDASVSNNAGEFTVSISIE